MRATPMLFSCAAVVLELAESEARPWPACRRKTPRQRPALKKTEGFTESLSRPASKPRREKTHHPFAGEEHMALRSVVSKYTVGRGRPSGLCVEQTDLFGDFSGRTMAANEA
jgi:hypothetical protein